MDFVPQLFESETSLDSKHVNEISMPNWQLVEVELRSPLENLPKIERKTSHEVIRAIISTYYHFDIIIFTTIMHIKY